MPSNNIQKLNVTVSFFCEKNYGSQEIGYDVHINGLFYQRFESTSNSEGDIRIVRLAAKDTAGRVRKNGLSVKSRCACLYQCDCEKTNCNCLDEVYLNRVPVLPSNLEEVRERRTCHVCGKKSKIVY